MTPAETVAYRRATFRAATKGVSAWRTAIAMNKITPGIDWRGSTKGRMGDAFASDDGYTKASQCSGEELRKAVADVQRRFA